MQQSIVITPENQEAPWLLFEAGALAKNLERSKVCPILFGAMEPTDVKGPLVQFQAAQFSKAEMKRVVKMMNSELADAALPPDVLENVFEMWWPGLEQQVREALEGSDEADNEGRRPDRDLLEEVLALTRRLSSERRPGLDHPVWDDMFRSVVNLIRVVRARGIDDETANAIRRLMTPLEYLAHHEMRRSMGRTGMSLRRLLSEVESMMPPEGKPKVVPEEPSGEPAA
jgi:hypothetical protein